MKLNQNIVVDQVGKVILEKLIQLKDEVDRAEKKIKQWKRTTLFFLLCFVGYTTYFTVIPNWLEINKIFVHFLQDKLHLFFLLLTLGSYGILQMVTKNGDKAEENFDALRCEIIRRSEEFWPATKLWEERYKTYEIMEKDYGINLFYES